MEKLLRSEQEVMDIIKMANHNRNKYEWGKTTITNWKNQYPMLARFTAEEIGRALKHQGLQSQSGRVDGVPHPNCYELPMPKSVLGQDWLHYDDSNSTGEECSRETDEKLDLEFRERLDEDDEEDNVF